MKITIITIIIISIMIINGCNLLIRVTPIKDGDISKVGKVVIIGNIKDTLIVK